MTSRFVFVTQELDPLVPGGAGAVISGIASRLAEGHEVIVVLGTDAPPTEHDLPFRVVRVLLDPPDGSVAWFEERSRRLAITLAEMVAEGVPIRLVEFPDFEAPGWWALTHRHELGLTATPIGIRLHGPGEAITEAVGGSPSPTLERLGEMERLAFTMADAILAPSGPMARWAMRRYGLDPDRSIVAPPSVPDVEARNWAPAGAPLFAGFGRLREHKGWQDLIAAAVPLLDQYPEARIRLIGSDGWSARRGRPMSEVLREAIPPRHRPRVEFLGGLPRDEALDRLAPAWAVVLPSRFETFCLAAHEARRAGFPVIAPDLPAFAEHRMGFGLRIYDGSVGALSSTLMEIAADPLIVERLAAEPAPEVADPVTAYLGPLPAPRHPNSQAGLATQAVQGYEPASAPGSGRSRLGRLMAVLPDPLVSVVSRLLPARLKQRLRVRESWWAEQARRGAAERRHRIEQAIKSGSFPDVERPRVSVVIPCYDQGEWVSGAVLSVFEQTHASWEVVLVDDGSTDRETIDELDRLAGYPRVRLVRQENRGLAAARNAGISAGRGELLVPLDADDELCPSFLDEMVAALDADGSAAFAHCWAELFGDVEAIWVTRPFNPYWQLLSNGVAGCVLLRRNAWEAVGGYDESMRSGHEDWELWNRLADSGWGQVRVGRPLFRYRQRAASMSVGSEAAFEAGLAALRERHRHRYTLSNVRSLKERWYPFVSLLAVPGGSAGAHDDTETIEVDDLGEAIALARGKFVADLRQGGDAAVALDLARRLEATPLAAGASEAGVSVWRRWALVDPGAEVSGVLGGPLSDSDLAPGAFPDPGWMVDPAVVPGGLRVMRQRPEEEGRLPGWVEP